ncbi:methyltransferase, FxLD system [Streptomyces sp. NPDC048669]|uniref:methyltransferase, FxLD system n=1 Tax=Streptomyces sp. NPDC048669 TaxID=3155267 RepID=UPI003413D2F3
MKRVRREAWQEHYDEGKGVRLLSDAERALLAEHVPAPENGRALDVGCGTGSLAVVLTSMGYRVDAVDFTEGALARARAEHPEVQGVRWLCLDVEDDALPGPPEGHARGYDLVTMRLSAAFIRNRAAVLRALGAQLRDEGALVVITPVVENTSRERRHIALDEDALIQLTDGFEEATRFDVDGLAVLVLRGPGGAFIAVEKGRPTPQAVMGAAAVLTDASGRVLLGRSTKGMWELPGGRIEKGESAQAAAVRELAEETGLTAREENAHVITVLHDDRLDLRRITPVVRITEWEGELGLPEADKFSRWEWHPLHTLATLGSVFMPAAHALNEVWPGVLPGLGPVHSYACTSAAVAVPGEPAEAARRRHAMADKVIAGGWASSPAVCEALRTVPRHRFAPETDLKTAYDDDLAMVTRRNEEGRATSSVSATWLQADMIEGIGLEEGSAVWEAGSGGYDAALLAHVVGPSGRVVTSDIDAYVVHRTQRFLAETGNEGITVFRGDAALGAPSRLVPRGGFDAIVITYNCWDIAAAWREQLAEGGRLVLPLEIGGYTRAITFQRQGDVLVAERFTHCGFVPAQGAHARTTPVADLLDGTVQIRFEDGRPQSIDGLEEALRGPRHDLATGVTMGPNFYFGSLQLYASTTLLPGFCRLAVAEGKDAATVRVASGSDAPALLDEGSLAYLKHVRTRHSDTPAECEWEWVVHAFGDRGPALAERLADTVRTWDRDVRGADGQGTDPVVTVYPAGTPGHRLPSGDVIDKEQCRLVAQWNGGGALRPISVGPTEAPVAAGKSA